MWQKICKKITMVTSSVWHGCAVSLIVFFFFARNVRLFKFIKTDAAGDEKQCFKNSKVTKGGREEGVGSKMHPNNRDSLWDRHCKMYCNHTPAGRGATRKSVKAIFKTGREKRQEVKTEKAKEDLTFKIKEKWDSKAERGTHLSTQKLLFH